ncbi:MAG TPA: phage major capsid protein [Caulobacteraceae bacterium]|jgi:HK97 family phage major capsid protein/HK97 family phage prohead protease
MTILRQLARAQINTLGDDEVEVILSTSNIARDGHVLLARGADLTGYRENPIVLWLHDQNEPVGRSEAVSVEGDKIVARVRFAQQGVSPVADKVRGLVKSGVITTMSIAFDPDYATAKPVDPAKPSRGKIFSRWTLLEASFVSVPSDTGAVVTRRSDGTSSIRSVEASLRATGMSAADAKRLAADWQDFSQSKGPQMRTTNPTSALARALDKFAPAFSSFGEPVDRNASPPPVHRLQAARAALLDGPNPEDTDDFEADLTLAREGVADIDRMIGEIRANQALSARTARPVEGQDDRRIAGGGAPTGRLLRNAATGEIFRAYRHDEAISLRNEPADWGLGDVVRAACTGDWDRLPQHVRAGSAGIGAGGGFLIPSEMSGYIVDLARAQARVLQAGALTVPMDRGNLSVAIVTADPQAGWKAENADFVVSQGSYGRLDLVSRTMGVVVPLSLELVLSASNINEILTTQLTKSLGLKLDAAAIAGDGTVNQPRGILPNIPPDNVIPVGAALASATAYSNWSAAIGKVLAANAQLGDLSILHNSDVDTALDGLLDTLYQPLRPTPNYTAIKGAGRTYVANGILTNGSPPATYSVVGDFSQVLFGMQQSLSIEVSREGGYVDAAGSPANAFSRGQVLVRAMIMCDVAILRPTFFSEVSDIRFS